MVKHFFIPLIFLLLDFSLAYSSPKREMRAIWISTVHNLDWPTSKFDDTEKKKEDFIKIVSLASKLNINTVFVQVRNICDAFYPSQYEPWSEWLVGVQGQSKDNWDPMDFMIEECKKRNIEFHAWFNPFRAISNTEFNTIDKSHISKTNKKWCVAHQTSVYLNPGIEEVRNYVIEVINEVVQKYPIDGVHLDDYFYPMETEATFNDYHIYSKNNPNNLSHEDWRRDNINQFIKSLSLNIKKTKPSIKFGISPVAVWRHSNVSARGSDTWGSQTAYDDLFADVLLWADSSWIDYLIPQLYQKIGHRMSDFSLLTNWWNNQTNLVLVNGLALYRFGNDKDFDWNNPNQICNQIKETRNKGLQGVAFYRAKNMLENPMGIIDSLYFNYFKKPALQPLYLNIDSIPPLAPKNLVANRYGNIISLSWQSPDIAIDGDSAVSYVIYRFREGEKIDFSIADNIVAISPKNVFVDMLDTNFNSNLYFVTSLDKLQNESISFVGTQVK